MAIDLVLSELHPAQRQVRSEAGRYNVLDCGRRWGKNVLLTDLIVDPILDRYAVGWWEPTYKSLADSWRDCKRVLQPITRSVSETERRIECVTGGVLDMWTGDNEDAGRGRKYKRIVVNEAAMIRALKGLWEQTIRPTLTDYRGDAWFGSTPKGRNYFWQLYQRGQDPEFRDRGWRSWHFPTASNPFIHPEEIEEARRDLPERAYMQEYMAEFLEDSAGVFRGVNNCVDVGRDGPLEYQEWNWYTMGVDLARVNDFTVLTVLDSAGKQVWFERFNEVSWNLAIERIASAWKAYKPDMVWVDQTGVGDPLLEMLQSKGVPAQGYMFTSRSKTQLVDSLAMAIERKLLSLMDLPVQTNELIGFEYDVTPAGNVRMEAPSGEHDDTVMALALANHGLRLMGYQPAEKPEEEPEAGERAVNLDLADEEREKPLVYAGE